MSGFTAAGSVPSLDYDFTAAPRLDGAGNLTLKGVLPEPTDERLVAFYEALNAMRKAAAKDDSDVNAEADDADAQRTVIEKTRAVVVDFAAGTISPEDIAQIPPRYLSAFVAWLLKELGGGDPKD
jgi:hypothetical protein